jgi:hypothetical protein
VAGRLAALAGCLENAKLHLELRRVAPEGLESLAHLLAVVAVARGAEILDARQ